MPDKPRARDLGVPFDGAPGPWNAITDVRGVAVGHTTLISGEGALVSGQGPVRTGVTAIIPRPDFDPVFAGWYTLNGSGELTGTTWVEESGFLQGPIALTNTFSVGIAHAAIIAWVTEKRLTDPAAADAYVGLPMAGETWDGGLNDIYGFHVRQEHVFAALDGAASGPVAEGNVGGGTGMICHGFKGGIGTSSRAVVVEGQQYVLGILVQANYGGRDTLTIAGAPVGKEIPDLLPLMIARSYPPPSSIIVVLATDCPLLPHQLERLARRIPLGIGRMGGLGNNKSGDIFVAFSTANPGAYRAGGVRKLDMLPNQQLNPLFEATVQATEEAIVNTLVAAETMTGINGNTVYALPHDRLRAALRKYGRLQEA